MEAVAESLEPEDRVSQRARSNAPPGTRTQTDRLKRPSLFPVELGAPTPILSATVDRLCHGVRHTCEHMFVQPSANDDLTFGPLVPRDGRPPFRNGTGLMKVCKRHGLIEFHRYGDGVRRRAYYRCRRCVGEAVTRRNRKVRRILVDEAGGSCCVCGYGRCVMNLHFHHVDPREKSFSMNMGRGKSLAAYQAEARKCVLVCANCHGEIESGLISCPSPGSRYQGAPRTRAPVSLSAGSAACQ